MPQYIQSIQVPDQLIAADGDQTFELPVNPLSVILLNIAPLNDTGTLANYSLVSAIINAITNVRVTWRGTNVIAASAQDLAAVHMLYRGGSIWQSNMDEVDDERRSVILPIIFGRSAFNPLECFPASRRGELTISLTFDIAATGFNGLRFSMETIELPGATPEFVEKQTTLVSTFAATGQNDIELPIGNVIRSLILFGTTGFTGAAPAPSWGQISILANNFQTYVNASDWEVMRGVLGALGIRPVPTFEHVHSVNVAASTEGDTRQPQSNLALQEQYAQVLFDVLGEDTYSFITEGLNTAVVRANAETADLVRVIPIEKVAANRFGAGQISA